MTDRPTFDTTDHGDISDICAAAWGKMTWHCHRCRMGFVSDGNVLETTRNLAGSGCPNCRERHGKLEMVGFVPGERPDHA